jgi:hypothetical protein
MNVLSRLVFSSVLLASFTTTTNLVFHGRVFGESRVEKTLEPKFFVGCPVLWSDGSRGVIVERPVYRDEEWYYVVQLGGADGLLWTLPEAGLKFRNQEAGER